MAMVQPSRKPSFNSPVLSETNSVRRRVKEGKEKEKARLKGAMSRTFSASSKKNFLVDRNDPLRQPIMLCNGKVTFFSKPKSWKGSSITKSVTVNDYDCLDSENPSTDSVRRRVKEGKEKEKARLKGTMSRTFSASSKKNFLVDRNNPLRQPIMLCNGKVTFFSKPKSWKGSSITESVTVNDYDCLDSENPSTDSVRRVKEGKEIVSASSKKVLVARNDPLRLPIMLCNGKVTFLSSVATEYSKPKSIKMEVV